MNDNENPYAPPQSVTRHVRAPRGDRNSFGAAFRSVLIQQVVVLTLAALLLDGGKTFRVMLPVAVLYWAAVFLPGIRGLGNGRIVRYGFTIIAIAVYAFLWL